MVESNKKRRISDESPAQDTDAKMEEITKTDTPEASATKTKRTLFVRSLPTSATTESLAEFFSQSYVIKHATAVIDPKTKLCKGYGFVTFADLEDAETALKELNGKKFEGKQIRVDYAQARQREIDEKLGKSVPSAAGIKQKQDRADQNAENQPPKLIVRNLPWSIKTSDDLALLFRSYGKVKWATLPKRNNTLAGFGFVIIRGKKNAEKAVREVNGKEIDGRQLAVDWAVDKEVWEKQQEDEEKEEKKEDKDVDMEDKEDKEASAEDPDDITSSEGEDDEDDDEESDEDDDMDDLEDLDDEEEDGEEKKADDRDACTVFLRNLPFTCDDEALYEHFKQFGPLRYARIVVDHETQRPRGTGFVCFWKPEDAFACIREAPKTQEMPIGEKQRPNPMMKHSVLQNENSDPSGRYTLDGRVLQVARAVNKREATKLEEEGVSRRLVRDKDKRRLYLLGEGTIPSNSPLYKKLSPSEIKMREESAKQREAVIKKNPALHLSLTRLAVRNIPRHITSKDLKQLARQAVVGFATDVKAEKRQPLSKEEQQRSRETMKELDYERKANKQGIVRQAKIVYETREGTKVPEKGGGGRSRGYGFIEYVTHRHALMGLRWLNCHPVEIPANPDNEERDTKKRLIVEFAIDNAQVIKRRQELQEKEKEKLKAKEEKKAKEEAEAREEAAANKGTKRKHSQTRDGKGKGKGQEAEEEEEDEEENKIAKRNRIIAKKRAQRKGRKGR